MWKFENVDRILTIYLSKVGVSLLRISLGIVYVWFGVLKFFPSLSPAEELVAQTMQVLSFGMLPTTLGLMILAIWETAIGIGLISGMYLRLILPMLGLQMIGAFSPLFLFPSKVFVYAFVPTLEGQYIIKNIVLVSAAIVIGATVRGGRLVPDRGI